MFPALSCRDVRHKRAHGVVRGGSPVCRVVYAHMEAEKDSQWKYACERVQFAQEISAAVFVHDPLDSVALWP